MILRYKFFTSSLGCWATRVRSRSREQCHVHQFDHRVVTLFRGCSMSTSGGYAESSTIRPRHIHTVRGARLSFYGLTGNRTEKVVPEFKTLATSIVPPSVHNGLADREREARVSLGPRTRFVSAIETIEDAGMSASAIPPPVSEIVMTAASGSLRVLTLTSPLAEL